MRTASPSMIQSLATVRDAVGEALQAAAQALAAGGDQAAAAAQRHWRSAHAAMQASAGKVRDLWTHRDVAGAADGYAGQVAGHGVVMLRVSK